MNYIIKQGMVDEAEILASRPGSIVRCDTPSSIGWGDCTAGSIRAYAPMPESFARYCDYCGTRHETIGNCINCGAPKR